jgi:signal transduction histidine kinase
MIEDLLALERLHPRAESATARLTTDVRSVIDEAIASQKEALQRAHCKVTVVYREGLDRTQGHWDRGYLLRLFANLLQNAVRHAPGAPVQIALARRGNRLGIVFADRGPGLTPAVADLGRDQRNDGAELDTHGLGLWIVRRAVQRLGGRLSIHNRPGHGVAFDLELPGLAL